MQSINANGKFLDLSYPRVMGIINLTPDSFHRGSRVESIDQALHMVEKMLSEGAAIIDLGGQSSRPRADRISEDDELKRIYPAVQRIRQEFPDIVLSVDTYYSTVASRLLDQGVDMINDISAGTIDPKILEVISKSNAAYVLMHMLGTPQIMQDNPEYDNVVLSIMHFLKEKLTLLQANGKYDVIIDPGFGFGKTVEQNYEILRKLNVFRILDKPILVGISRKSMIYKALESEAKQALNGTTALHMVALQHGAKILRVHDVKEAQETITLYRKVFLS